MHYAAEAAWKEDNRRLSNGDAFRRTAKLALASPVEGLLGAERGVRSLGSRYLEKGGRALKEGSGPGAVWRVV